MSDFNGILLNELPSGEPANRQKMGWLITPRDPEARGAQLSFKLHPRFSVRHLLKELERRAVVVLYILMDANVNSNTVLEPIVFILLYNQLIYIQYHF